MHFKVILYLFGFIISVVAISYLILYSNLLELGYNFNEYVHFIIRRIEVWIFIIGLMLELLAMVIRRKKNE